jgi:hypothetical protein
MIIHKIVPLCWRSHAQLHREEAFAIRARHRTVASHFFKSTSRGTLKVRCGGTAAEGNAAEGNAVEEDC